MTLVDGLRRVRAAVVEGEPLDRALKTVADPHKAYEQWSPLWDELHDAQTGSPKRTLAEIDPTLSEVERLALVDRAIAHAMTLERIAA